MLGNIRREEGKLSIFWFGQFEGRAPPIFWKRIRRSRMGLWTEKAEGSAKNAALKELARKYFLQRILNKRKEKKR